MIFTLPFKSKTICLAVFLPIPGNLVKYVSFSFSMARFTSLGVLVAKIAKADFGPIPVTLIKLKNISFSSSLLNPYNNCASSRTIKDV